MPLTDAHSPWIIALALDSLGAVPARNAIIRSREIGYHGVGITASRRDFSPRALGESGVRDLKAFLAKNDLAATLVWAGDRGMLALAAMLQEDVEKTIEAIGLASALRAALGIRVGALGAPDSTGAANLREALPTLSDAADRAGVMLALESSPGESAVLGAVLKDFPGAPAGRLFDPGAALFSGRDPVDDASGASGISAVAASDASADAANLAPGEGRVPWREVLAALGACGYHAGLTVRFQARGDSAARAAGALETLRRACI